MPAIPWKWYSIYNIDPSAPSTKNLTDAEIIECIELFRGCAKIHRDDNFKLTDGHTLDEYKDRLKQGADDGYVVMGLRPSSLIEGANTLFFLKSKALAAVYGEDVWGVSLGLEDADFPIDGDEPVTSRGYVRDRFQDGLQDFLSAMRLNGLYSIDAANNTTPDAWGRPISRLEYYGLLRKGVPDGKPGDPGSSAWEEVPSSERWESGNAGYQKYWAGDTGHVGPNLWIFRAAKIRPR